LVGDLDRLSIFRRYYWNVALIGPALLAFCLTHEDAKAKSDTRGYAAATIHKLSQGNISDLLSSIDLIASTGSSYTARVFHRYTDIDCPPNPMPTECKESTLIIAISETNLRPDVPAVSYAFETSPDFDWRFTGWTRSPEDMNGTSSEIRIGVEKLEVFPPKSDNGYPIYVWAPYEIIVKANDAQIQARH